MAARYLKFLVRLTPVFVVLAAVVAVLLMAPFPGPTQIRDWARSAGPALPLIFFAAHALVTVTPFPRTAFTISAGMLFGPWLGLTIAVGATTASALLTLLIVRMLGDLMFNSGNAMRRRLNHRHIHAINARLARRGWVAVGALRLIAAIPFSIINYACAVSAVRPAPFTVATAVGVLPGTVGVVFLGDALTGQFNPWLLALSAVCFAVGIAGLLADLLPTLRQPAVKDSKDLAPAR